MAGYKKLGLPSIFRRREGALGIRSRPLQPLSSADLGRLAVCALDVEEGSSIGVDGAGTPVSMGVAFLEKPPRLPRQGPPKSVTF